MRVHLIIEVLFVHSVVYIVLEGSWLFENTVPIFIISEASSLHLEFKLVGFLVQEFGIDVLSIVIVLRLVSLGVLLPQLFELLQVGDSIRVVVDVSFTTLDEGDVFRLLELDMVGKDLILGQEVGVLGWIVIKT